MNCGRRPAPRNVVKWDVGRACPQAAADVCGNEKPCGLCCRGRRPSRPAEGSRPLPTMQRIKGVVMARWRAGHARPLQGGVNGSRMRGARERAAARLLFACGGCPGMGDHAQPVGIPQSANAASPPLTRGPPPPPCGGSGELPTQKWRKGRWR